MHLHILGICGKFMSGLALIAQRLGHKVTGSDANIHSSLAAQLRDAGIALIEGYDVDQLKLKPDCMVIGNVMRRGMPIIEAILNENIAYDSGPGWLSKYVCQQRWVLAVSGTHGKTTTTSMLAWILEYANYDPGFLIGGLANNFTTSARATDSNFFVIEADEYDSAFFDKRPKFLHYNPRTLIINNLEFDHADIYNGLEAIQTQFHFLLRMLPGNARIIVPQHDDAVAEVLTRGCWSELVSFGEFDATWHTMDISSCADQFTVLKENQECGTIKWPLIGQHNVNNGLAAIAAAEHVGIKPELAIEALNQFKGVQRRMQVKGEISGAKVIDDFAHHPTAIATTLAGLRAQIGEGRILAIVDFGSYTMRTGVHEHSLPSVFSDANEVFMLKPAKCDWNIENLAQQLSCPASVFQDKSALGAAIQQKVQSGDHIIILSNQDSDAIVAAIGVSNELAT